jgi:hypothetical protein
MQSLSLLMQQLSHLWTQQPANLWSLTDGRADDPDAAVTGASFNMMIEIHGENLSAQVRPRTVACCPTVSHPLQPAFVYCTRLARVNCERQQGKMTVNANPRRLGGAIKLSSRGNPVPSIARGS